MVFLRTAGGAKIVIHIQHVDGKKINRRDVVEKKFLRKKKGVECFFFVFLQHQSNTTNTIIFMEITITEQNFDEVLKSNAVVMVDFGATWCGPCKALAPVVEEIANDYAGRAAVGKADVDQCPSITARFRIRNVPTVLFFQNGELKDKSVGAVQKKTLTDKIDALL